VIAEFYKKHRNAIFILALFIVSFAVRVYYLPSFFIYGDEAAYAEIIEEFIRSPSPIPHYMGHIVSWKPPLGFATYSALVVALQAINPNIPIEIVYRVPALIFGVLSTIALYFMVRKLYDEETAFVSSLIFSATAISVALSETILLDQLVLFLLLVGVVVFMEGRRDAKYFYYSAFIGALIFLTKSIMAFLLPVLAIAYYFGDRELGKNPRLGKAFLISLSTVPLTMFLYAVVFFVSAPVGRGGDITVSYVYDFFRAYSYQRTALFLHSAEFIRLTAIWCVLFFAGLLTMKLKSREDRFIFIWLLLMLVFLGAGQFYVWYYLQVLPPFTVVCAKALLQVKRNKLFIPALLLLFIFSLPYFANPAFMDSFLAPSQTNTERVQVALFIKDKTDVLSITDTGVPEIVFYKFHAERHPDYAGFKMVVLNPFELGSYTAYEYFADLIIGDAKVLNITDSSEVDAIISSHQRNEYVVMDKGVYNVYSQSPSRNYSVVFNSSYGTYLVLRRAT